MSVLEKMDGITVTIFTAVLFLFFFFLRSPKRNLPPGPRSLPLLVPLGVGHRATEDFKLCGYDIPKDATVFSNLFSVLRDPDHWEDPDRFNPNRFLSSDGAILKHTALIPFSIGPRVCLGETLARTEVFVFFANLLQHFIFSKEPGDHEDYLSRHNCPAEICGAVIYKTKVTRRD